MATTFKNQICNKFITNVFLISNLVVTLLAFSSECWLLSVAYDWDLPGLFKETTDVLSVNTLIFGDEFVMLKPK